MDYSLISRHLLLRGTAHQVVEHAGLLYVGGIVSDDPSADMIGQTRRIFQKLDDVLLSVGSGRDRILFVMLGITDMSLKPLMNEVWLEWFAPEMAPARVTFGISAIEDGSLLELVAIAAKRA